jgi:hypothetical protein
VQSTARERFGVSLGVSRRIFARISHVSRCSDLRKHSFAAVASVGVELIKRPEHRGSSEGILSTDVRLDWRFTPAGFASEDIGIHRRQYRWEYHGFTCVT